MQAAAKILPATRPAGHRTSSGGMTLASTHMFIDLGIPVPGALFVGTPEADLSNTVRVHRKLRTAGVVASLNVYEGFSHGEYLKTIDPPESEQVFAELSAFILEYLEQSK